MGWNSWNHFGASVTAADIRHAADALVSSGMAAAGYRYVIVDDGWQGQRDSRGVLHPNAKFPDMKALAGYVHGKGLKFGIYSSPGERTCGGYAGSAGHEAQDARMFAAWGVDYLKYDMCSFTRQLEGKPPARQVAMMKAAYLRMHHALDATGRPIVYALCNGGWGRIWTWGAAVGGNLWRSSADIRSNYQSMLFNATSQLGLQRYAGPGHWNDPDMLEIGNPGMDDPAMERTHMSLGTLLAAPLIAGNDLSAMNADTRAVLTNPATTFPRWVGYLNLWVAFAFVPDILAYFFFSGPFAWNGIFVFWLALTAYVVFLVTMSVVTRRGNAALILGGAAEKVETSLSV